MLRLLALLALAALLSGCEPALAQVHWDCRDGTCAVWNETPATAPLLSSSDLILFDGATTGRIPTVNPQTPLIELTDPRAAFPHYGGPDAPPMFAVRDVLRVRMLGTVDAPRFVVELLNPRRVKVRRISKGGS